MAPRREKRGRWRKLRGAVWPRMGPRRLTRYYWHRMGRMGETPYAIAAGFASGVAISFTPFLGFHLLLGGLMAWALRGSLLAMALGSIIAGNIWTFPFIFIGTYQLGAVMLGRPPTAMPEQFTWDILLDQPLAYLWPMALGSIPAGLASGVISFYFVRRLVKRYKGARRDRLKRNNIRENN